MQRAESRIKSLRNGTDADLFMVKNLLILKNELVSLEMGDIRAGRGGSATSSAGGGTMQHFGAIWGAMNPVSWVGFVGGYVGSFIWSSSSGNKNAQTGNAAAAVEPDISSQLDDLLRRSIYAFTERWGALLSEARGGATGGRAVMGGKNVARIERDLDTLLQNAFGGQPEVVAKLKEAIEINARAQSDARAGKKR